MSILLLFAALPSALALQLREAASDADAAASKWFTLHMMTDKGLGHDGAVCLDGSDAGFYFAAARDKAHEKGWQIAFEGGGWCYSESECAERTKSPHGTSKFWTKEYLGKDVSGFMSFDCNINPDFCRYNRVVVPYCDGGSFTGNRDEPVDGTFQDGMPIKLYFRGKRIVDSVFDTILEMGLRNAEDVILTGHSAGGLATLLHADYIHGRLQKDVPNMNKFRAVPLSGFFLDTRQSDPVESKVFGSELEKMVPIMKSENSMDSECIKDYAETPWKCILAPIAYRYVQTPTFIVNSGVDEWQIAFINDAVSGQQPLGPIQTFNATGDTDKTLPIVNVVAGDLNVPADIALTLDDPDSGGIGEEYEQLFSSKGDPRIGCLRPPCAKLQAWENCIYSVGFEGCTNEQVKAVAVFQSDFEVALAASTSPVGDGAFIHSCPMHSEALESDAWSSLKVNGVTMQEAFYRWWQSSGQDATKEHTWLDCRISESPPYKCNPTCQK